MKPYSYFRSSAAYRVRIALALKGLSSTPEPVHMLRGGGEQHAPGYSAIHPQRWSRSSRTRADCSSSRSRFANT